MPPVENKDIKSGKKTLKRSCMRQRYRQNLGAANADTYDV